jgi:hypothetical protein
VRARQRPAFNLRTNSHPRTYVVRVSHGWPSCKFNLPAVSFENSADISQKRGLDQLFIVPLRTLSS